MNIIIKLHRWTTILGTLLIIVAVTQPGMDGSASARERSALMTMETIGTAPSDPKNPAAAQREATSQALGLALDAAVRKVVPAEVLSSNFEIIDPLFFGQGEKFVLNYTVLAVYRQEGYCRSLVRATFADDVIKHRITGAGVLLDREIMPRILLLISEKETDQQPRAWWRDDFDTGQLLVNIGAAEKAMRTGLKKRGLLTAAAEEVMAETIDFLPVAAMDRETALELARRVKADFVISGDFEADNREPQTWRGRARARALEVKSGRLLQEISIDPMADAENPVEALEAAGEAAAAKLSPAMVKAFLELTDRTKTIEVIVRGEDYLAELSTFQERLRDMEAISHFQLSEMKINQAVFKVTCAVSAARLAAELGLPRDGEIRLIPEEVSDEQIIISIHPADPFESRDLPE